MVIRGIHITNCKPSQWDRGRRAVQADGVAPSKASGHKCPQCVGECLRGWIVAQGREGGKSRLKPKFEGPKEMECQSEDNETTESF